MNSEKRSLARFLAIYLISTLLLFSLASWIYYTSSKHYLLEKQLGALKREAIELKITLRKLQKSQDDTLYYPNNENIKTAIYDIDKNYIFGNSEELQLYTHRNPENIYYTIKIEPYYLGAAHALLSKKINYGPIQSIQKNILLFMLGAGVIFTLLGYFLGRLFTAPMRQAIDKMNHFIQDTTHELNTPISTILTNIELIDTLGKHTESDQELRRIEIASKTLSRIYDDLTYLNLNHNYYRKIEPVNISEIIQERVLYFSSAAKSKELHININAKDNVSLDIDKNDALRLIDNLLSNAIKYNKQQGNLEIYLDQNRLSISDSGIGIDQDQLEQIFLRFKRANTSEGGFGIGLHIVSQVCNNYGYNLNIQSAINQGTKVEIKWSK